MSKNIKKSSSEDILSMSEGSLASFINSNKLSNNGMKFKKALYRANELDNKALFLKILSSDDYNYTGVATSLFDVDYSFGKRQISFTSELINKNYNCARWMLESSESLFLDAFANSLKDERYIKNSINIQNILEESMKTNYLSKDFYKQIFLVALISKDKILPSLPSLYNNLIERSQGEIGLGSDIKKSSFAPLFMRYDFDVLGRGYIKDKELLEKINILDSDLIQEVDLFYFINSGLILSTSLLMDHLEMNGKNTTNVLHGKSINRNLFHFTWDKWALSSIDNSYGYGFSTYKSSDYSPQMYIEAWDKIQDANWSYKYIDSNKSNIIHGLDYIASKNAWPQEAVEYAARSVFEKYPILVTYANKQKECALDGTLKTPYLNQLLLSLHSKKNLKKVLKTQINIEGKNSKSKNSKREDNIDKPIQRKRKM